MGRSTRALSLAAALLLGGSVFAAEEIVMVVNAENTEAVDVALVRDLYWGRERFWPESGFEVELSLRAPSAPVTVLFLRDYLKATPTRFDRFWTGRMLSGQGSSPKVIRDLDALVNFCTQTPGAIGFLSAKEADRVISPRIRKIRLRP